jgi:hypothetical protein
MREAKFTILWESTIMSNETSSPVAKWILITIGGVSMICIAFFIGRMTQPIGEYRVADELQARGFEIEYARHDYEVWKRPIYVWGDGLSITEDDCRLIGQLPRLQILVFQRCDLSELNLDDIGNCQELRIFQCDTVTLFPADEIRKLAVSPVDAIVLRNTPLNDANLEYFTGLTKLEYLDLRENTEITDAGLEHLEKIAALQILFLTGTSVTQEGVEEFQRKRPDMEIEF